MVSRVESGNGWARSLGKDYNFFKTCWIKETHWENVKQNLIFIHFFFTFSFFLPLPLPPDLSTLHPSSLPVSIQEESGALAGKGQ